MIINEDTYDISEETLEHVIEVITEVTSLDVADIHPESNFREDLGMDMENELAQVVRLLNTKLEIDLDADIFLGEEPEDQTVENFVDLVDEELEF